MSAKRWVVVNIGCLECGVTSNLVGVFTDKRIADEWANRLQDSHGWRQSGQNSFEVFLLPPVNVVAAEYEHPPDVGEERKDA